MPIIKNVKKASVKTANKLFSKKNYAKTMGSVGKFAGKIAPGLTAAVVASNPELIPVFAGFTAAKWVAGKAEKRLDKHFEGKTGKGAVQYRTVRDMANGAADIASGNLIAGAGNYAHVVGDSRLLGKKSQRKFDNFSQNYLDPTVQTGAQLEGMYNVHQAGKGNQAAILKAAASASK
jgi:hypothetical protein